MNFKDDVKTTLQDTLHSCLRCGKPAHECEEGVYRCDDSVCGFVWRVINCDE